MKRCYTFFVAFLLSLSAAAQDSTYTEVSYNCDELAYYYSDLLTFHYSNYSDDSLRIAMNEWENACGLSEPLLSFKILYAIEKGTFTEDVYNSNIAAYLIAYQDNTTGTGEANVPAGYYPYLQAIAKGLAAQTLSPLEKTLVDFYISKDEAVLEQMDSTLSETTLYKSYVAYKEEQRRLFGTFHMAVLGGAWIPDGNIKALGSHPLIGIQLGSAWKDLSFDFNISIRFTNAPRDYQTVHYGYVYDTRYHVGTYLGLDGAYKVSRYQKHAVSALFGIGYDGLTLVRSSTEDANDGKNISSLNLNAGIGYKYHFKSNQYIGLMGKYNFLFYKNRGGTDLSGNALTIVLVYGFTGR